MERPLMIRVEFLAEEGHAEGDAAIGECDEPEQGELHGAPARRRPCVKGDQWHVRRGLLGGWVVMTSVSRVAEIDSLAALTVYDPSQPRTAAHGEELFLVCVLCDEGIRALRVKKWLVVLDEVR